MSVSITNLSQDSSATKVCRDCGEEKTLDLFYKSNGKYYKPDCKECTKAKSRERNKDRTREQKDAKNAKCREKYVETKEVLNEKRREKYQENREEKAEYHRAYYQARRDEIRQHKKNQESTEWELAKRRIQSKTRYALTRSANPKNILEYSGCSVDFLVKWIGTQLIDEMSTDNYGIVWVIDHTKPCSQYDLLDETQAKECYYWPNLRPMFKNDNERKNNKYSQDLLFQQYKKAIEFQKNYSKIASKSSNEPGLEPILAHFLVQGPRVIDRKETSTALGKTKKPFRPKITSTSNTTSTASETNVKNANNNKQENKEENKQENKKENNEENNNLNSETSQLNIKDN